jgi:hypothetical protein
MTTSVNRETATIIPFPLSSRMMAVTKSRAKRLLDEAEMAPLHDFGSWYHEEAILESTDGRKPKA